MKSRILLCLPLVLCGGLMGCSTGSEHSAVAAPSEKAADEKTWQITLRAATTNAAAPWTSPFSEPLRTMNYTVPADVAKILEGQPPAELLPFLAKLRMEPPSWKAGIVDEWITIVRDGLHGRPGVITNTFTTAKGVTSTNDIPIYTYREHFVRRTQNNLDHLLGTNIEDSAAISGLSLQDIQDINVAVEKQTLQRVITLGRLTKTEAWVLAAAPAWDAQNHREEFDRYRKGANGWQFVREIGGMPLVMSCEEYLFLMGPKFGCHFTLEFQGYSLTKQPPQIESFTAFTTNDLAVASITDLLSNLRRRLNGFIVKQDFKNPKVFHIIEKSLEQQKHYTLNKRISLRYAGNLVGCHVEDAEGRNLVKGEGLPDAISKKTGNIRSGTTESASGVFGDDCYTVVKVDATNETVRSILTDYIPLTNYSVVVWRAVTISERGKTNVLVRFYGAKPANNSDGVLQPSGANVPSQGDPNTGLPPGHMLIDPTTGLPLKRGSQP